MSDSIEHVSTPAAIAFPAWGIEQIEQIFDSSPNGIITIDRDWKLTWANRSACKILPRVEVGCTLFELYPGALEGSYLLACRKVMERREPARVEAFYPDPIHLWFSIEIHPFADGIVLFFPDINVRKQLERREQELARTLVGVMEAASDAVMAVDRSWRFTYINRKAGEFFDPERQLLGKNHWEEFPLVEEAARRIYYRAMEEQVEGKFDLYYPEPLNAWYAVHVKPSQDGIVVFFRDITEQRERDRLVHEQQETLAVVQHASRLATWELDTENGCVTFGPGAFEVLGHPVASITSLPELEALLLPGHAEQVRASIQRAIQGEDTIVMEFAVKAADGSIVWIEARGRKAAGPGKASRLRGVSIDITGRKLAEQRLITSEARYRVLADLNPQAIWMGDPAGNVTYANQGFLNYIGMRLEDLSGTAWLNAFNPADRARVLEVWLHSVNTGTAYDIEAMLGNAATAQYRYWHLRAAPVYDASGAILHWLGVASDVHDARTHAAELHAQQLETERQRAEIETIYETAPIALALLDPVEFRFLRLNERQADLVGLPKQEILGRTITEIAPIPGLREMFQEVAQGRSIRDHLIEGELPARPGELRFWNVSYLPVHSKDGSIQGITAASIEITQQKKAEAALIQSEKLAAVGRLASSISHEINNPLEAITNLLYLIAFDDSLPGNLKDYVYTAQAELARVSQIATQSLRFHRQSVAPTSVTGAELVAPVIQLHAGRLANSHIRVEERYDSEMRILCFENDIRQVLNNLVGNAIDAMRTGGRLVVRVHAAREAVNPEAPENVSRKGIRITIADTGHGMSAAVLARVYEPFFTTKDLLGTGLGLWISAGIVDRHYGRLHVRSSEHARLHGTVFSLFLPCEGVSVKK